MSDKTLTRQLIALEAEAVRLKKAIDDCPHEFVEAASAFESHHCHPSGPPAWALVQRRCCLKCGLRHKRLQLAPNSTWNRWDRLSDTERNSFEG